MNRNETSTAPPFGDRALAGELVDSHLYSAEARKHPRILVVDDDPTFRDILGLRIEKWGYEVRVAAGPREAHGVLARWYPDLIFSDVVMPEASGFQFVDELRAKGAMCPVVLLTAHGTVEMLTRTRQMKGVILLLKPVDYVALRAAVDRMMHPVDDTGDDEERSV